MILEVCTGGYLDGLAAAEGGAQRIELNTALPLGGLSADKDDVKRLKRDTNLEIICMVRPRPAGFFYTEEEFVLMKGQAEALLKAGADGIAFGFLTKEREVDERRTKEMVSLIHQYGGTAVFHRAFDLTKDADASMQSLISAGIDRALTSGQMPKAIDGLALLAYLQRQYGNQIEILAGSGIHEGNVQAFVQAGLSQVHSSCKGYVMDPTTTSKTMGFSYLEGPYQNDYEVTSAGKVRQLLEALAQA